MKIKVVARLVAVVLAFSLAGCLRSTPSDLQKSTQSLLPGEEADPINTQQTFEITEDGEFIDLGMSEIPASAFSNDPSYLDYPKDVEASQNTTTEQVSPILEDRLSKLPQGGSDIQRVSISFEDDLKLPYFATTVEDEPIDSPANQQVIARNNELIRQIEAARKPVYDKLTTKLEPLGVKIVELDWLTSTITAELPLKFIPTILTIPQVLYITSTEETSPSPVEVDDGRRSINSDSFYNQGSPVNNGGMIALIDTGVKESHSFISRGSYSRVRNQLRCFSSTCVPVDSSFLDPCNHGTSSAAIMSGNTTQNAYRGVTGIGIDAFNIYSTSSCGGYIEGATAAFKIALGRGHKVIVAEMQFDVGDGSQLSLQADRAFDLGAVVIAANGNYGSSARTVRSPANAHKAIGVGAFDLRNGSQYSSQSRGPADDGRIKPDIQAPTYTDTASANGSNTAIRTFGGTSGATPYAAGAAALVRNWFADNGGLTDPGRTYAYLIASGTDSTPDNTTGAGRLRVGGNARWIGGKPQIKQGQTLNLTFKLTTPSDYNSLRAAIWWPETAGGSHSDIDLFLVDPGGTVRASSRLGSSVFEVAQVSNPVAGDWTVRIVGKDVNVSAETVYYFAGAKR